MTESTPEQKSYWPFCFNEEQARALFLLAGIPVLALWRIENRYWPTAYTEERAVSPWFLVKTERGMIEIGWRKRVISINWIDTKIKAVVTEDDVTKDSSLVHAYSYIKALEYLTSLGHELRKKDVIT